MQNLELAFDFDAGLEGQLQLNGRAVLNRRDTVEVEVSVGKHVVQWFLVGDPGAHYSIGITDDGEELFAYKGTMTNDGQTAGFKKFEVEANGGDQ